MIDQPIVFLAHTLTGLYFGLDVGSRIHRWYQRETAPPHPPTGIYEFSAKELWLIYIALGTAKADYAIEAKKRTGAVAEELQSQADQMHEIQQSLSESIF